MAYCHTCKTGEDTIYVGDKGKEDSDEPVVDKSIIPEPEVHATPVAQGDERIPGGANQILNLLKKSGWEIIRLTYARGPRVGAKGEVLSISDSIALIARPPLSIKCIVATWLDGSFNTAYTLTGKTGLTPVNSKALRTYIKEHTSNG